MNHTAAVIARSTANVARRVSWGASVLGAAFLLSACETPLNDWRAQRFSRTPAPAAVAVVPQARALTLRVARDGQGLAPESLRGVNELLTRQGRIASQVLTITPLNERGAGVAPRLALALVRAGAQTPRVEAIPAAAAGTAQAADPDGDLELQSEALVTRVDDCRIARADDWAIHPYDGVGALGCATRANLARMASDPRDLARPQTLDGADGRAAAGAVERYQTGAIRALPDIDFEEDKRN